MNTKSLYGAPIGYYEYVDKNSKQRYFVNKETGLMHWIPLIDQVLLEMYYGDENGNRIKTTYDKGIN